MLALWPVLAAPRRRRSDRRRRRLPPLRPAHPTAEPMPLTSPAKSTLSAIQDNWLQWDSAFQRGEEASAGIAIDDLLQAAGELGMSRLPEVCSAVLARATLSAADGGTPRARWALDMAERLDPGRPEVEFARAAVARHEAPLPRHDVGRAPTATRRLGSVPLFWRLTAENLLIWALAAVIVAGALFVALQLAAHGASLIDDIAEIVSRRRPITTAYLAALVVFILPVLVPAAWVALPLYWAILLLPYARPSERAGDRDRGGGADRDAVRCSRAQARRVAVELSAPMDATRSLEERRLYGGLIKDVERAAHSSSPTRRPRSTCSPISTRTSGQVEYARLLYQRLVEVEPLNVAAHNNIGVYYLRRRETSQAIDAPRAGGGDRRERASSPTATCGCSTATTWRSRRPSRYSRVCARSLPNGVANWFTERGPATIAVMRDGYERAPEIRARSCRAAWKPGALERGGARSRSVAPVRGAASSWRWRPCSPCCSRPLSRTARGGRADRTRPVGRWPGCPGSARCDEGRGWRAFFARAAAGGAVLLLPRLTTLGYRLPWGFNPGTIGDLGGEPRCCFSSILAAAVAARRDGGGRCGLAGASPISGIDRCCCCSPRATRAARSPSRATTCWRFASATARSSAPTRSRSRSPTVSAGSWSPPGISTAIRSRSSSRPSSRAAWSITCSPPAWCRPTRSPAACGSTPICSCCGCWAGRRATISSTRARWRASLALRPLAVEEVLVRASEEDPRLLGGTVAPLGGEVLRPLLGRRRVPCPRLARDARSGPTDDVWLTPFEDALLRSLDGLTPAQAFKKLARVSTSSDCASRCTDSARLGLVERVERRSRAGCRGAGSGVRATAAGQIAAASTARPADPPARTPSARSAEAYGCGERAVGWSELGGQLGDLSRALQLHPVGRAGRGGAGPGARRRQRAAAPSARSPGRRPSRQRLENLRLQAQERDLIGKLKTYRILYGAFPLDLRPLVDTGLVRPGDLEDSHGRGLSFEALDQGFVLGSRRRRARRPRARGPTSWSPATSCSIPTSCRIEGRPGIPPSSSWTDRSPPPPRPRLGPSAPGPFDRRE